MQELPQDRAQWSVQQSLSLRLMRQAILALRDHAEMERLTSMAGIQICLQVPVLPLRRILTVPTVHQLLCVNPPFMSTLTQHLP